MNAEECEHSDQKSRHEPVCVEEIRELVSVVVSSMGQVADELSVRIWVASAAGLDYVLSAQCRCRV